jgi:hypothetical protein
MITQLDLNNYMQSLPALFAAWVIPFSRSIGTGAALAYLLEVVAQVANGRWRSPFMWILGLFCVGEISLFLILSILRDEQQSSPLIDLEALTRSVGRTCSNLA